MKLVRISTLAAVIVMMMTALTICAQGPLRKRVNYSINVPYTLRMGSYVLPPGDYVLYQVLDNDLNLFALYRNDMMRPPIAMIRTARIDYQSRRYPEKTKVMLSIDEENYRGRTLPILRGWTIPGMDGWEVISVVERKKGNLTRADQVARARKVVRTKRTARVY